MYNIVYTSEGEHHKFVVEDRNGYAFLHTIRWENSLKAYKAARKALPIALKWLQKEGYDGLHTYTQNERLMKSLPMFVYLQDLATDEDGGGWRLYNCQQQQ